MYYIGITNPAAQRVETLEVERISGRVPGFLQVEVGEGKFLVPFDRVTGVQIGERPADDSLGAAAAALLRLDPSLGIAPRKAPAAAPSDPNLEPVLSDESDPAAV